MNGESNAVPETMVRSQATTAARANNGRAFYWSVRREIWENRAVYLAPLGVGIMFLIGFAISTRHLHSTLHGMGAIDPKLYQEAIGMPYDVAAAAMMATAILFSFFYSADALYGERRDRSILFWKSLPVSDTTTVLSKVVVVLVVVPVIATAFSIILQFVMLLYNSAVLLGDGVNVGTLWSHFPLGRPSLLLLYHLMTAHALWPLPVYCYLMLVSGSVRRAPLLWAALPVVAVSGIEKLLFHTSVFLSLIGGRMIGNAPGLDIGPQDVIPTGPMTHITPEKFLSTPGLWIGLLLSAVFLFAAIRLRRYQGPV